MYLKQCCCHFIKNTQHQKMKNVYQFHPKVCQIYNYSQSRLLPYYKNQTLELDTTSLDREFRSYAPFQERLVNGISQFADKALSMLGYQRNTNSTYTSKSEFVIDKHRRKGEPTQLPRREKKVICEFYKQTSLQTNKTKTNQLKSAKPKIDPPIKIIKKEKRQPRNLKFPHLLNLLKSKETEVKKYKKKKTIKTTLGSIPKEFRPKEHHPTNEVKKDMAEMKQKNATKVNEYKNIKEGTIAKLQKKQLQQETEVRTEEELVDTRNQEGNNTHINKTEQSQFKGDLEIKEEILANDYNINQENYKKIRQEISNDFNKGRKAMLTKLNNKTKEERKQKSYKQPEEKAYLKADTQNSEEEFQSHENKSDEEAKLFKPDITITEDIKFKPKQIDAKQSTVKNYKEIEDLDQQYLESQDDDAREAEESTVKIKKEIKDTKHLKGRISYDPHHLESQDGDAQEAEQSKVDKEIEEIKKHLKGRKSNDPDLELQNPVSQNLESKSKAHKKKIGNVVQTNGNLLKTLAKKRDLKEKLAGIANTDAVKSTNAQEINKTDQEGIDGQIQQETTVKEYEITVEDLQVKERKATIHVPSDSQEYKSLTKLRPNKNASLANLRVKDKEPSDNEKE